MSSPVNVKVQTSATREVVKTCLSAVTNTGGDAVLLAVRAALVRPHDKEGGRQRVRTGGVCVDDGDAAQGRTPPDSRF